MRPPSIDQLARELHDVDLPHELKVEAARAAVSAGDPASARERAEQWTRRLLQEVVNGTGVLLHTNLGRAPLGSVPAVGYQNLELDLETGRRGSRSAHVAALVARVTGAESALVVNNGAAAIVLVLAALARGQKVIVSRGELVEIGGGFRIPEILTESGAALVEVGTTNRTNVDDYRRALAAHPGDVGLSLKVHTSNYRVIGFTVAELTRLGPPVVVDLGSGLLDETAPWSKSGTPGWLGDEPGVRQTLEAGATAVTFSGDKLWGGPQAGLIAGRATAVSACAGHPLARALRPGGLVLASLQATTLAYLERRVLDIPLWHMALLPLTALEARADRVIATAGCGRRVKTESVLGGGAAPERSIPSIGVGLPGDHRQALRAFRPPVVARVTDDGTVVDLRTVGEDQDPVVAAALRAAATV
jgi:L-seryl-tRNA(Ser) seleniumtransferase